MFASPCSPQPAPSPSPLPLNIDGRSLLDAARKLVPQIRAAADETHERRELPRPLFEAMADAGLFHMAVPRPVGGAELDLPTYVLIIEEIGKADASTGWCLNQGAIFGTYAARMPSTEGRPNGADVRRDVVAHTPARTSETD